MIKNTLFWISFFGLFKKYTYKIKRPVSEISNFILFKIVDFRQVLFFCLKIYMGSLSKYFLSFLLLLTCFGTSFFRSKPLDELAEEQLEDGLTLFFEPIFAYVPVNVEVLLFFLFWTSWYDFLFPHGMTTKQLFDSFYKKFFFFCFLHLFK